ncbi:MAG: MarC family protein [Bacteroidetes bacterium]|nr:MarC family protein [Bacteroidota bacterium]
MGIGFSEVLTVSLTLFAVIDMLGSVPIIISLKSKIPNISAWKVTLASGVLMIGFLYAGESILKYLGIDRQSFALAGSVVMFILGLEMVLGIDFFRSDPEVPSASIVPIAFPIIAGSGTLTTILSLKAIYDETVILLGILPNLLVIFIVMISTGYLERKIGKSGMLTIRKFFGVILLAIAVKIFRGNV